MKVTPRTHNDSRDVILLQQLIHHIYTNVDSLRPTTVSHKNITKVVIKHFVNAHEIDQRQ